MTLPKRQQGWRLDRDAHRVYLDEFDVPAVTPRGVILRIHAAGVCHSDISTLNGTVPVLGDHFVLGHEIAGEVVAIGDEIDEDDFPIGFRAAVHILSACGACRLCRGGRDNVCEGNGGEVYGLYLDGGFQEYMLVQNTRLLVEIPDNVLYAAAAATLDAVLTPYRAIQRLHLRLADRVLIIGVGGLGLNALQLVKLAGCHVVCVDTNPATELVAMRFGADEFYTDLRDLDYGLALFQVVLDLCGYPQTVALAQEYVDFNGRIGAVGMGSAHVEWDLHMAIVKEVTYSHSFGGSSLEQAECMRLVLEGKLAPMYTVHSLDTLPQQLARLDRGEATDGRIIMLVTKNSKL